MTLYYSLVFVLLVFEMVLFMSLIVPMPFKMKRGLFTFISENPIVAKLQYGLKVCHSNPLYLSRPLTHFQITFIFILILFVDSVNRVYRVQIELAQAGKTNGMGGG